MEQSEEVPHASCLCSGQGNIQAKLKPGLWFPGLRALHYHEEIWEVLANPSVCAKDITSAIARLQREPTHGKVFVTNLVQENSSGTLVEILVFSNYRWCKVLRVKFETREGVPGSVATVHAFTSGILPSWFPLGFIFSCVLFFLPIYDFETNTGYLRLVQSHMTIPVTVVKSKRKL